MKRLLVAALLGLLIVSFPVVHAAELHLTYDANGNLVTGDGKFRVYNSLNQLAAIYNGTNSSGALLEEFTYHPTEERILVKKTYDNGSLAETVYYFSNTFVRVNNGSDYDFTYVYHNGQLVTQEDRAGNKLFVHGNHEGSSSVVTNESGTVVERTEYSPFGEQLNASRVRFGYEGKEQDSLVGDTDFHFRKYKAEWGLFTQPDDVIDDVYDPQKFNRFAFERNNPLRFVDPDGHRYAAYQPIPAGFREQQMMIRYQMEQTEYRAEALNVPVRYGTVINMRNTVSLGPGDMYPDGAGVGTIPAGSYGVSQPYKNPYCLLCKDSPPFPGLGESRSFQGALGSGAYREYSTSPTTMTLTPRLSQPAVTYQSGTQSNLAAPAAIPQSAGSGNGGPAILGTYRIKTGSGAVTVKIMSGSSYANVRAALNTRKSSTGTKTK